MINVVSKVSEKKVIYSIHAVIITSFFLLQYRKSSNSMHNNSVHFLSLVIYALPLLQTFNTYSVHCNECRVVIHLSFTSNIWYV